MEAEIFSAHIIVGTFVFALGTHGKSDASHTRKFCMP